MEVDALLVPAEVVAHEVYAQLSTPLLWRFLREMPARGDEWAGELIDRLTGLCGTHLQALWKVRLDAGGGAGAAGAGWPGDGRGWATCCAIPEDRDEPLHAVVAAGRCADGEAHLAPGRRLRPGRRRRAAAGRLAGRAPGARAPSCSSTPVREYVLHRPAGAVELDLERRHRPSRLNSGS